MKPDWISKDCIDVGLFTNQLDPMLAFWRERVGLNFDHMLPVGGGIRQHRLEFETGILKLNHSRAKLEARSPGGYQRLIIGKADMEEEADLIDPDGNRVKLVPKGLAGIEHWAVEIETPNASVFFDHYHRCLGLPKDNGHPISVRCGRSLIIGVASSTAAGADRTKPLKRTGFRYSTIQVHNVDTVHSAAIDAGVIEAAPPSTLGRTARISFLKDPNGNWMELSQRASITGSLEPE